MRQTALEYTLSRSGLLLEFEPEPELELELDCGWLDELEEEFGAKPRPELELQEELLDDSERGWVAVLMRGDPM